MATNLEHRDQADHNMLLLRSLDPSQFPDWHITISFYAALHLVEAHFSIKGVHSGSHTRRNQNLKRDYQKIWKEYRTLYCFSRLVRYRCYKATGDDLENIDRRFRRVESLTRP